MHLLILACFSNIHSAHCVWRAATRTSLFCPHGCWRCWVHPLPSSLACTPCFRVRFRIWWVPTCLLLLREEGMRSWICRVQIDPANWWTWSSILMLRNMMCHPLEGAVVPAATADLSMFCFCFCLFACSSVGCHNRRPGRRNDKDSRMHPLVRAPRACVAPNPGCPVRGKHRHLHAVKNRINNTWNPASVYLKTCTQGFH